jgi:hypothetical protein
MAIGGALRAAIKAGNWTSAARESRRRARALAELNLRGGVGRPGRARGADEYLRGRGVDVDAMTAPGTGNPYMDWVEEDFGPIYSDNPFGGVNFFDRGRTMRFGGEGAAYNLPATLPAGSRYSGPIQAPYEGFRVIPQSSQMSSFRNSGDLVGPPGPWQGRGRGTEWAQSPVNGYDALDGTYYSPVTEPIAPSWRFSTFGDVGYGSRPPRFSSFGMTPVPFDEVMRARGSLMGDPRFGPYVPF